MTPTFDLRALYDAIDAERRRRGLTWAAVVREINGPARTGRLAASTLAHLQTTAESEGDGVLLILRWLGQAPEHFVPGVPDADAPRFRLPEAPDGRIVRWDTVALHNAIDQKRVRAGQTWAAVAKAIGGVTPGMLTHLAIGGRTSFPAVMRIVGWLGQPATTFTRVSG